MSEEPKRTTTKYPPTDIGEFMIEATETGYSSCEFLCYECCGFTVDGNGNRKAPIYEKKGSDNCEPVEDVSDAQPFLSGFIKWDGCANLMFDEQEDAMLHFCGRKDAQKIGMLIDRLYDLAAELIPDWDEECAK